MLLLTIACLWIALQFFALAAFRAIGSANRRRWAE